MSPTTKIILRFLAVLALTMATYTIACLAMGRPPTGGAMALMTAVLGTSVLFGLWSQTRIRSKAIADYLRCGACGYNLTGHKAVIGRPEMRCPECGGPLQETSVVKEGQPHPGEMRRSQRRLTLVCTMIGLLGLSASAALMINQGRRGGHLWVIVVAAACMAVSLARAYWKQQAGKR